MEIVTRAWPAEFGDHDALAGMHLPQLVVELDGVVHRMGGVEAFPVRQDVRGDEVNGRCQLRMIDPDRPDFTGSDRHRALPLHLLDEVDQLRHGHLGSQRGFVADDDGVDVAVMAGKLQRGANFTVVAGLILVDPGADRDFQSELGRYRWNELGAASRRIGADGVRVGRYRLQIGANLLRRRALATIGV